MCALNNPSIMAMADSLHVHHLSPPSLSSSSSRSSHSEKGSILCRCIATLRGHLSSVSALACHAHSLYSASIACDFRVWQHNGLLQLNDEAAQFGSGTISGKASSVKAILVSGNKIFSAHQDHKIRVWKHNRLVATLPTRKDCILRGLFHKNYVQVRRHHKRLWIHHVDAISVLAMGVCGRIMYSGSWDKSFKVWRISDLKCLESVKAHDDAINALLVSPCGIVFTASADCQIKAWAKHGNERRHSHVATLEGHTSAVNALWLSQDAKLLYSGDADGLVLVWEMAEVSEMNMNGAKKALESLRAHKQPILCIASAAEGLLFTGSADNTVKVWGREGGVKCVLEGHMGPVKCLAVCNSAQNECLLYSGSMDKSIKVWWIYAEKQQDSHLLSSCFMPSLLSH